ncbi:MAG: serine hydrolase [bacterium]
MSKPRKKRIRWIRVFTLLCVVVLVAGAGTYWYGRKGGEPVVVLATPTPTALVTADAVATPSSTPTLAASATPFAVQISVVKIALQKAISAHPELIVGASFIDLNTGTRTDVNGDRVFTAASTTKALIACLVLSQVEAGKHSLSDPLDGGTVKSHLQRMINQSNNDSWMDLMQFIGYSYQIPYAKSIGITTYDFQNNRISPNDDALLLSKLYAGKLLNQADTALLLSYMHDTNFDYLIPPAVPKGVKVFHKYGDYEDGLHDTAIIDDGKNPFVLTIYTNSTSGGLGYEVRYPAFQEITKAVEEAMNVQL